MGKKMSAADTERALNVAIDEVMDAVTDMEQCAAQSGAVFNSGYCRFCGFENHTEFERFETQAEADAYVSDNCNCAQATKARARREEQTQYKNMVEMVHYRRESHEDERAEVAQRAMDTINLLFGDGAAERGQLVIDDEVLGFLHTAAMMVYEGMIGAFSTSVAPSVTVKITCKKQVLAIERGENTKQKMEVI